MGHGGVWKQTSPNSGLPISPVGLLECHYCTPGEQLPDGLALGSPLDGVRVHEPAAIPTGHVELATGAARG
eukprot:3685073-Prorocentrum_lima.AAC.1